MQNNQMAQETRDPSEEKLQKLAERVSPGSRVVRWRSMTGGSSAEMTAIELRRGDGASQTILLRRCGAANLEADPHTAATEHRLLKALHARGLPVPEPLHLDESRTLFEKPFLIIAFLEGEPDYAPADPLDAARQMAVFLAGLHRIDPDDADLAFVARPEEGPGYLEITRDVLPAAFGPAFDALQQRWPPAGNNCARLLHGDLWPGNLLWVEGRLTAVVDWEDATVGDPLADVAIARTDLSWSFGFEAVDRFTQTYAALTGFDLSALPLWDLRATLRQAPHAADYAEGWQELGRPDVTETLIHTCHARIVARARDALQT